MKNLSLAIKAKLVRQAHQLSATHFAINFSYDYPRHNEPTSIHFFREAVDGEPQHNGFVEVASVTLSMLAFANSTHMLTEQYRANAIDTDLLPLDSLSPVPNDEKDLLLKKFKISVSNFCGTNTEVKEFHTKEEAEAYAESEMKSYGGNSFNVEPM